MKPTLIPGGAIRAMALLTAVVSLFTACRHSPIRFVDAFPGRRFDRPVYFGVFPGAPDTYVVLEQHRGLVLLVAGGEAAPAPDTLLRLEVNQAGEMGLLGIAFHPDFAHNGRYFIAFDPPGALYNVVQERRVGPDGRHDVGAGIDLIRVPDKYTNHNGGTLAFGPKDGDLYIGMGDGGYANDPDGNGQNLKTLFGKMLRLDVDHRDSGAAYGIPRDNPFAAESSGKPGSPIRAPGAGLATVADSGRGSVQVTQGADARGIRPEIFAYGLRNPWKWAFDPVSGDLWAGDVGQNAVEEVDLIRSGGNYGWSAMEGPRGENDGRMILPVFSYPHGVGNCVIGGVVYRGDPGSRFYGHYFVADHGSGRLWALRKQGEGQAEATELGQAPMAISSFGTDESGRMYVCGLYTGIIYRLEDPDLGPRPNAPRP